MRNRRMTHAATALDPSRSSASSVGSHPLPTCAQTVRDAVRLRRIESIDNRESVTGAPAVRVPARRLARKPALSSRCIASSRPIWKRLSGASLAMCAKAVRRRCLKTRAHTRRTPPGGADARRGRVCCSPAASIIGRSPGCSRKRKRLSRTSTSSSWRRRSAALNAPSGARAASDASRWATIRVKRVVSRALTRSHASAAHPRHPWRNCGRWRLAASACCIALSERATWRSTWRCTVDAGDAASSAIIISRPEALATARRWRFSKMDARASSGMRHACHASAPSPSGSTVRLSSSASCARSSGARGSPTSSVVAYLAPSEPTLFAQSIRSGIDGVRAGSKSRTSAANPHRWAGGAGAPAGFDTMNLNVSRLVATMSGRLGHLRRGPEYR